MFCVICCKYGKFEQPKISYFLKITLAISVTSSKCRAKMKIKNWKERSFEKEGELNWKDFWNCNRADTSKFDLARFMLRSKILKTKHITFWYSNNITSFKFRIFIINFFIELTYVRDCTSAGFILVALWYILIYLWTISYNSSICTWSHVFINFFL